MARKKEFDQEEVLDKAVKLFWQKGYHATSAQDLVDCLGISRSSLYDTYSDKRSLFEKSLRKYQEKNTAALLAMADKAKDAELVIKQIFEDIIHESSKDTLSKGCFMVNTAVEMAGQDIVMGKLIHDNNKMVEDALARLVKKGQEEGQLSLKRSARAYARFLLGTITALRVAARSSTNKKIMMDIVDVTLASISKER